MRKEFIPVICLAWAFVIIGSLPALSQTKWRWCLIGKDILHYLRTDQPGVRAIEVNLENCRLKALRSEPVYTIEVIRDMISQHEQQATGTTFSIGSVLSKKRNEGLRNYRKELDFYSVYNQKLELDRKRKKDSLAVARQVEYTRQLEHKRRQDSLQASQRVQRDLKRDSLRTVGQNQFLKEKQYMIVTVEQVHLRSTASDKSASKALVYGGSLVSVLAKQANRWYKVRVSDYSGYLSEKFLTNDISSVRSDSIRRQAGEFVESGGGSALITSGNTDLSDKKSTGSRKYFTGPKGGCFYYSASGRKVYVDRSYCQ